LGFRFFTDSKLARKLMGIRELPGMVAWLREALVLVGCKPAVTRQDLSAGI
jgi:hypothetical protein